MMVLIGLTSNNGGKEFNLWIKLIILDCYFFARCYSIFIDY
jgi:hypothetical protein